MLFRQLAPQSTQRLPLLALLAPHQLAGLTGAALGTALRLEVATQFQGNFALEQGPATVAQAQAALEVACGTEQTVYIGETEKKEIYHLIKKGQRWLIDQLQVADESMSKEKMKL